MGNILKPTMKLRWVERFIPLSRPTTGPCKVVNILQQMFVDGEGNEVWEDIEIVKE
jgi:hypothetical protein